MTCSGCAKRRAKLQALRDRKKQKGQQTQAAALGAVLAVTDTAAKVLGIKGEDSGREDHPDTTVPGCSD